MPSRVRADGGGENVLIAQLMIRLCDSHRNSFIVGESKHMRLTHYMSDTLLLLT